MRLIDADKLMEHVGRDKLDSRELIMQMVKNAPTVEVDGWEKLADRKLNDLLECLETIAIMDVNEQHYYFNLRQDMVTNCYEGLYAVITTHTAAEIFKIVALYSKIKHEEKIRRQEEKVRKLAEEIGIHNLYSIVKKLRGE